MMRPDIFILALQYTPFDIWLSFSPTLSTKNPMPFRSIFCLGEALAKNRTVTFGSKSSWEKIPADEKLYLYLLGDGK
jgi:hypothetical protein